MPEHTGAAQPDRPRSFVRSLVRVVIGLGAVFVLLGFIAALPVLLNDSDRRNQKLTMMSMVSLANAIESFTDERGERPDAASVDELRPLVEPEFILEMPARDAWDRPFDLRSGSDGYEIRSPGADRVAGGADDIAYADGKFTHWPEGIGF